MAEAKFINPAAPVKPGLDFVALRARGIEIAQQLAGDSWTDYNEHDPGVTTLEQLCYALTDLSYRASLPIEDLLAQPGTNAIDRRRQGMIAPAEILPGNPLTENDYRKLIVDRVPGVANAWMIALAPPKAGAVDGLYDIELFVPDGGEDSTRAAISDAVRQVYVSHRGLCEDVRAIRILEPAPVTIAATVIVDATAIPERVLAGILHDAANFLAPEIRRRPLDQLIAAGQSPAVIFSGPLLARGFISDEQLQARADRFTTGDLTQAILGVSGVISVRDLEVAIDGTTVTVGGPDLEIAIPPGRILTIDRRSAAGASGIRLFIGDVECRLDAALVRRELEKLWTDHRRTYALAAQSDSLLPFPKGTAVDVGEYYSVQHQFPAVYGVNAYGVPSDESDARQAQAKQFKAYLLVFEQILTDALATLKSATRGAFRGPRYQYLDQDRIVPDVGPLLKSSYRAALPAIAEGHDDGLDRRNRLLDAMLAPYAETLDPLVVPPTSSAFEADAEEGLLQARGKLQLLRRLGTARARRGAGCDYLSPPVPENVSGLEVRTRLQLGMPAAAPRRFETLIERLGVPAIAETAPVAHRELMLVHGRHIEKTFRPLTGFAVDPEAGGSAEVSEDLLLAAAGGDQFRIGVLPGETDVTLVCRAPSQRLWQMVGRYSDERHARAGAAALHERARALDRYARRLFVVEHTLLRFGRAAESSAAADVDFEYNFTISAVVCVPAREAGDPSYRLRVCDVLRANTPAHVVINGCFVRLSHVAEFERLYWDWRRALTTPNEADVLAARCRDLRSFLRADRR